MTATTIETNIHAERCHKAQATMVELGLDYLFIGPGADMRYLTGTPGMDNERMMLLIIPQNGTPAMIVPALEKLATSHYASYFDLLDWYDSEGPNKKLQAFLGEAVRRENRAAVGAHLWSTFLLTLQNTMPQTAWTTATEVLKRLRIVKSAQEIELLKQAAANADRAFDDIVKLQFAGRRELDVMTEVNRLLLQQGQETMEFCIVGSGPNGAQPHHHTGERVIQPGEMVVLDFGGAYKGYNSDMTRTLLVEGTPADSKYREVYDAVNKARAAAHAHAKPGVTCESVDEAARQVIVEAGYGEFFVHRTGHGIGMEVHEEPYIVAGNQTVLEPGMAFSIEPGIYLPGRFGVRIEDIAVVTEAGEENINLSTHELMTVK